MDVVTKTETVAKPEVCVSLVDVTGACRRKRGIYEGTDILSLVPTPVHPYELFFLSIWFFFWMIKDPLAIVLQD